MRGKEQLSAIKKDIDEHVGEKVVVKANSGRKKFVVKEGILEKTYPNIFIVRVEGNDNTTRTISYSYSDILTQTVQIIFKPKSVAMWKSCFQDFLFLCKKNLNLSAWHLSLSFLGVMGLAAIFLGG